MKKKRFDLGNRGETLQLYASDHLPQKLALQLEKGQETTKIGVATWNVLGQCRELAGINIPANNPWNYQESNEEFTKRIGRRKEILSELIQFPIVGDTTGETKIGIICIQEGENSFEPKSDLNNFLKEKNWDVLHLDQTTARKGNVILYDKSEFKPVGSHEILPEAAGSLYATYTRFKHIKTNQEFWVANFHAPYGNVESGKSKAAICVEEFLKRDFEGLPVIMAGDMNSVPKVFDEIKARNAGFNIFAPEGASNFSQYIGPEAVLADQPKKMTIKETINGEELPKAFDMFQLFLPRGYNAEVKSSFDVFSTEGITSPETKKTKVINPNTEEETDKEDELAKLLQEAKEKFHKDSSTKIDYALPKAIFTSNSNDLKLGEDKVTSFNSDLEHRILVSAYLREAAREVSLGKKYEDIEIIHKKRSPLVNLSNGIEDLKFPKILDEKEEKIAITKDKFEKLKKEVAVFYDDSTKGVDELYAKKVLKQKYGEILITEEVEKNKANLVSFVIPTRICYHSVESDSQKLATGTIKKDIYCKISEAIDPPIEAKIFNFTYPKFTDPNWWGDPNLKKEALDNISKMFRLNLIAVCNDHQKQETSLPFILNPPGAFIRKLTDDQKIEVKKAIAGIFTEVVNSKELKPIIQKHISEFIILGGEGFWGEAKTEFEKIKDDKENPNLHLVNADIVDIAQKLKANNPHAQLLIPMMGEGLGAIGNGALGNSGVSALDEDLFRRCLGIHAALGNHHLNPLILKNIRSISETLRDLKTTKKEDDLIINLYPSSSPKDPIKSSYIGEVKRKIEGNIIDIVQVKEVSFSKPIKEEEIRDAASIIMNESLKAVQQKDRKISQEDFGDFIKIMREVIKEKIKSNDNSGKDYGFQAWRNNSIKERLSKHKADQDKDIILKKYDLISAEIQKQAFKYFDTTKGRHYPDAEIRQIGARSYRVIQLLDEKFELGQKTGVTR